MILASIDSERIFNELINADVAINCIPVIYDVHSQGISTSQFQSRSRKTLYQL